MGDDATARARRPRDAMGSRSRALCSRRSSSLVYRQVLGMTQRPSWPPPATPSLPPGRRPQPRPSRPATALARTTPRSPSPGRPRRRSSRWSRARTSSRGSSRTSRPRARPCTSSCSAGARASRAWRWRRSSSGSSPEGVEVRVIVDSFGSRPYEEAREMFTGLAAAGAQIVVNDVFPLDRDGLYPDDQQHRLAPGRGRPRRPPQALRDRRRRSRGPAGRGSRITSRTAASTT